MFTVQTYIIVPALAGLFSIALAQSGAADPMAECSSTAAIETAPNIEAIIEACENGQIPPPIDGISVMTVPAGTTTPAQSTNAGNSTGVPHWRNSTTTAPMTKAPSTTPEVVQVLEPPTSTGTYIVPSNYGSNGEQIGSCILYLPMQDYQPPSYELGHAWYNQCLNICNNQPGFSAHPNSEKSVTCIGHGTPAEEKSVMAGVLVQGGSCSCNNPLIDQIGVLFIQALQAIGNAMSWIKYLLEAFETIAAIGVSFIPGVGEAIDAGLVAAISAAKVCEYTYDAARIGQQAFEQWAQAIPAASKWPQGIFDTLRGASDDLIPGGWKAPDYTKGSGKPGDEGCVKCVDNPHPDDPPPQKPKPTEESPPKPTEKPTEKPSEKPSDMKEPTQKPSTNEPTPSETQKPSQTDKPSTKTDKPTSGPTTDPKTTDKPSSDHSDLSQKSSDSLGSSKSSSADQCSLPPKDRRGLYRRKGTGCDNTVTVVRSLTADVTTIPVSCKAMNWNQACYNYYSAIHAAGMPGTFTCSDSHDTYRGKALTATRSWSSQHPASASWRLFVSSEYKFQGANAPIAQDKIVACDADEFPPAYFRDPVNTAQVMRLLPAAPNAGAGSMWRAFCKKNDGGVGNALSADRKIDNIKSLYKLGAKVATRESKGNDGTTTTTETYDAHYSRAVYSQAFDWTGDVNFGGAIPAAGNDWGLRKNPCWPEAILENDPGFALQTNDPYYIARGPPADGFAAYRVFPPVQSVIAANSKLVENGYWGVDMNQPGYPPPPAHPNKLMVRRDANDTKTNYDSWMPRGRSIPKRGSLMFKDDQLAVRDEESGALRMIARDELDDYDELEITKCADAQCTKERRALDQDEWVMIPAAKRSMSPPAYAEAVSTSVPSVLGTNYGRGEAVDYTAHPSLSPSKVALSFGRRALEHDLPKPTGPV